MAASLVMLYPFAGIACQPTNVQIAAFGYAFTQRGLTWAKYIVAAGASVGVFTSTGISVYGLSRVFQVFSREGVFPPIIGRVNGLTNTPVIAVLLSGLGCGVTASLSFAMPSVSSAYFVCLWDLQAFWPFSLPLTPLLT